MLGVLTSFDEGDIPCRLSSSGSFTDPRLCAAIVDRLTFGGNIIETGTDSYRLVHARQKQHNAIPA
jgi:hypothetical protein